MLHFANITIFSLVFCLMSTGASLAVESELKSDESAAMRWLQRAEVYAKDVQEDEREFVWTVIASLFARFGEFDEAQGAADNCDDERKHRCLSMVAIEIFKTGRVDEAAQFTKRIPEGTKRDYALGLIIRMQANAHEFEELKKMIQRMKDPEKMVYWAHLAESLAKAGRYDEALEVSKKIIPNDEYNRDRKLDVLELIVRSRTDGRRDKPWKIPTTIAASARAVVRAFAGGNDSIQDLAKATAAAEESANSYDRASQWRRIAWAHIQRGAAAQARIALGKALEATREALKLHEIDSFNLVLIADAYLELGDQKKAAQLVDEVLGTDEKIAGGLDSFTTGPVVVGVLVRTGNIDQAFRGIDLEDKYNDSSVMAFGAFCALEGKRDEVEKRLEKVGSPRNKANLCLGMAEGLYELEQTKKPAKAINP